MLATLPLPATLATAHGTVTLRRAALADLDALVRLLSDDAISASRGDRAAPADLEAYGAALAEIVADGGNEVILAVDGTDDVIGTFQLTRIPGVSRRGSSRLQIEAVRVSSAVRSGGVGSAMMRWVMETAAPAIGCALVQLTSDAAREDAHRFYERLGFAKSHVGFKFEVPSPRRFERQLGSQL